MVREQDWEELYDDGRTKLCMRAEWSANEERCHMLQSLAANSQARRVLEIGSFCGVGALALAEALPEDGEVHAVELDAHVVSLGKPIQMKSPAFHKLRHIVGTAQESLQEMVFQAKNGVQPSFDLVIVDADKENMRQYFRTLVETPGLLSAGAVVCVDLTHFKGQIPKRYLKYNFPYRWETDSGMDSIDAFRTEIKASERFEAHEVGTLLVVQKKK